MATEPIYAELWTELLALHPFTTYQRRFRMPDDVKPDNMPAMFLVQEDHEVDTPKEQQRFGAKPMVKNLISVKIVLYVAATNNNFACQEMNPVVDKIVAKFGTGNLAKLGGLVEYAAVSGPIKFFDGTKAATMAATIPIQILAIG